jgi:hypothetical protein
MPNRVSPSSIAPTAFIATGSSSIAKSEEAPVKSRFQMAWPGSDRQGRMQHAGDFGPGGEPVRHLEPGRHLLLQPDMHGADAAQRQEGVLGRDDHAERLPGQLRAGACRARACGPRRCRSARRNGRHSIWCRPGPRGRRRMRALSKKSGVAQVLSIITSTSRACAAATIAGMSCISKVCEPGASVQTALVFGLNSIGDAGAGCRIVIGDLDAVAAAASCRRNCASGGRRCRSPEGGRRRRASRAVGRVQASRPDEQTTTPAPPSIVFSAASSASIVGLPCVP